MTWLTWSYAEATHRRVRWPALPAGVWAMTGVLRSLIVPGEDRCHHD